MGLDGSEVVDALDFLGEVGFGCVQCLELVLELMRVDDGHCVAVAGIAIAIVGRG